MTRNAALSFIGLLLMSPFAWGGDDFGDAYMQELLVRQQLDVELAPIKSTADLARYMASQKSLVGPLSYLSPGARGRFLASLKFGDGVLGGFRHDDIAAELTPGEAYELLSLFGVQRVLPMIEGLQPKTEADRLIMSMNTMRPDIYEYECVSRRTCKLAGGYICLDGC